MKKIISIVFYTFVLVSLIHSQEVKNDEKVKDQEVQLNYTVESLSRNFGTWRTASLHYQKKFSNKQIVWGDYRVSDRNSDRDSEFAAGIYKPLKDKWAFTAEMSASPTGKYVGKVSVGGEVEKGFKDGWVAHVGTRYTKYISNRVVTSNAQIEKYWGNNRAAYTLQITNLSTKGTAANHRLQFNRYYGENVNSFGITVSKGKEIESLGPAFGVIQHDTWSLSFSERHWVTKNFGVNVDASLSRQGNLYYRRGVNFGVRYRF